VVLVVDAGIVVLVLVLVLEVGVPHSATGVIVTSPFPARAPG
jgi:hypothetical protein